MEYAPSKRPYALDLGSVALDERGKSTVKAVWVTRKDGKTRVSEGFLWGFGHPTLDAFLSDFDARYGGDCRARWDGTTLWAPDYTPEEHAKVATRLNLAWANLPEVPDGFTGWYSIKAEKDRSSP